MRTTIALCILLLTGCAEMSYAPVKYSGGLMTGTNGMTLYTFDKDVAGSGKSVCNGPCATAWPPMMAPADGKSGGDWTVITRDDGSKQWAYGGKPLYTTGRRTSNPAMRRATDITVSGAPCGHSPDRLPAA